MIQNPSILASLLSSVLLLGSPTIFLLGSPAVLLGSPALLLGRSCWALLLHSWPALPCCLLALLFLAWLPKLFGSVPSLLLAGLLLGSPALLLLLLGSSVHEQRKSSRSIVHDQKFYHFWSF